MDFYGFFHSNTSGYETINSDNGGWHPFRGSTYASIYGTFIVGPVAAFTFGSMLGAATETFFTEGSEAFGKWETWLNVILAGAVGGAVGYFTGEATVTIAEHLADRIVMRQNYAELIRGAFDNLTPITDQVELKKLIDYMRANPVEALEVFQQARKEALSEAVVDTMAIVLSEPTTVITTELSNEIVSYVEGIARGFEALRQIVQGRV